MKQMYTLGFQVMASVEGRNGFQPISQRYASRSAAEGYKALAVKEGFGDAWVKEIQGFEPELIGTRRQKKELIPKKTA